MTSLKVDLPEVIFEDLKEVSKNLKQTPEECIQMALSLLMQFDSLQNALIAMARVTDNKKTVPLPILEEDSDLSLEFHPDALEELQILEEDDQLEVLSDLIDRISASEEALTETIDLVINEDKDSQVVLSCFEFGDMVYKISSEKVVVYLLSLHGEEDFEEIEFEDEELH